MESERHAVSLDNFQFGRDPGVADSVGRKLVDHGRVRVRQGVIGSSLVLDQLGVPAEEVLEPVLENPGRLCGLAHDAEDSV